MPTSQLPTPNSKPLTSTSKLQTKNSQLKICVLGTRGFPNVQGGVETHCEHLYPQLVREGCEVVVFTREGYIDSALDSYKGVRLVSLSCPKNKFLEAIVHTFKGVFQARKLKPDILHIHAIGPSLFAVLGRILGLKVVLTHHGPDYKRKKWPWPAKMFLKFCEWMGVVFSHKVITIAQNIADDIKTRFGKDAVIIPNGVDIKLGVRSGELGDSIFEKYGLEKGKYILAVGRFVPEKGFHDLIVAYSKLRTPNSKLVIVGDADHEDKYSKELKKTVKKLNSPNSELQTPDSIILTGFLTGESLEELYSYAGLFVLPSYYEGLPIVLLEALSYGLSCIASDIPANRNVELLAKERFFKVGDIEALAGKIKEFAGRPLTEDEKKRQLSGIADKYDWEKIAKKTLEVYQGIA